jgi:hypothetical protein
MPRNITKSELDKLTIELKTPHENYTSKIIDNSFVMIFNDTITFTGFTYYTLAEAGDFILFINTGKIKIPFLNFHVYSNDEINLLNINRIMLLILVITAIVGIPEGVKAFREMGENNK